VCFVVQDVENEITSHYQSDHYQKNVRVRIGPVPLGPGVSVLPAHRLIKENNKKSQ
jgi:hypothetical protein